MRQERFTEQAQEALALSQQLVQQYHHSQWDVEHILLALLQQERGLIGDILRELGVDTVIVTGYRADNCVLSTYRGAQDFDFTPIILKGSLASDNVEHIRFVEEISEIISFGALKTLL